MTDLSRRAFVGAAAVPLLAATRRPPQGPLTAQQVVDRIRANAGVPWREASGDGFKAGDPSTILTGVVTTVLPTLDVLRRAAAARRNLIVTHEPLFYSADENPGARAS